MFPHTRIARKMLMLSLHNIFQTILSTSVLCIILPTKCVLTARTLLPMSFPRTLVFLHIFFKQRVQFRCSVFAVQCHMPQHTGSARPGIFIFTHILFRSGQTTAN
ncbi:hypothetical protein C8R43DRAFT_1033016 [Mycena crocata]|nr:hypothetical protein C8R43DRAFT_1033016 [Mycena crocata]